MKIILFLVVSLSFSARLTANSKTEDKKFAATITKYAVSDSENKEKFKFITLGKDYVNFHSSADLKGRNLSRVYYSLSFNKIHSQSRQTTSRIHQYN